MSAYEGDPCQSKIPQECDESDGHLEVPDEAVGGHQEDVQDEHKDMPPIYI